MIRQLADHLFLFYKYIVIFTGFGRCKFRYAVLSYYFCATTPISMEQQNQADLLQDVNEEMHYVDPAPRSLRFVNHIVDQLVIGIAINGIKNIIAISSKGTAYKNYLFFREDLAGFEFSLVVTFCALLAYYTIFEAATKGKTLGKILTGTIAVTQNGTPFTFRLALMRTLCRFIPFEPFSAFGYMPWHDSITKTCVVKKTW